MLCAIVLGIGTFGTSPALAAGDIGEVIGGGVGDFEIVPPSIDLEISDYTITVKPNGATSHTSDIVFQAKAGLSYEDTDGNNITSIPVMTRTGFTLKGYYDAASGGNMVIPATGVLPAVTTFTADTTLYAQWTPVTYTITLNDNSGAGGSGTVKEVYNTKWTNSSGTTITSVTKPTRTGYTFNGYYTTATGGTQKIPASGVLPANTTFTADTKLYAQWTVDMTQTPRDVGFYCDETWTTFAKTQSGADANFVGPFNCSEKLSEPFICNGKYVNYWHDDAENPGLSQNDLCSYIQYII